MSTRSDITDVVRARLKNYSIGDQLAGVADLCDEFNVQTATAVYAMRPLLNEGLVESRRGGRGGYFVAAYPPVNGQQVMRDVRARLERIVADAGAALRSLDAA